MSEAVKIESHLRENIYNTTERLKAACEEHSVFTPKKIAKQGYLVLEIGVDISFDYESLANQPRIYNIDRSTVDKYLIQCRDGVDQAGEIIKGIRSAVTVAASKLAGHPPFVGLLGHHRYTAAKDAGCKYVVAKVEEDWHKFTFEGKQDFLMTDNAHKDNGKQNSQASVKNQLATLYSKESNWMIKERQRLTELQSLLEAKGDILCSDKKAIEREMKEVQKKLVSSKVKKVVKWMDKAPQQAKSLATNVFNHWRQTHEAGIDGKLGFWEKAVIDDRKERPSSHLYVPHKISVKNDSIMITNPAYHVQYKASEYYDSHGEFPTMITVYIGVPSGVKSVKHLFEIRKGYHKAFEKYFDGNAKVFEGKRENLKVEYKFIGQINKGNYEESNEKFYNIDYVNEKLASM